MKTILLTAVTLISMLVTAQAGTYTYMCKVGSKSYPVTVTTPSNDDLEGGTITWRGRVFQDVKLGEGCRYNFLATAKDGTTAELCTATKGVADLTIRPRGYVQLPDEVTKGETVADNCTVCSVGHAALMSQPLAAPPRFALFGLPPK